MSASSSKLAAGKPFPALHLTLTNGDVVTTGQTSQRWQLLVVYRGKHCGRCKKYLNTLETMQSQWQDAGFDILAISADTKAKVEADIQEFGWTFPIAFGLSETDMRTMGVYISDPLTPDETDRRFAEPAVFCIRPNAKIQIVALSNGPSARPDLAELLDGMIFTINNDKPPRGTVV